MQSVKYINQLEIDLNYLKSMEFIDQECSSTNGEESSELTSEYDSSIYSDNADIEFLSPSSEDNNESAPCTQKFKASVSDEGNNTGKSVKKESSPPVFKTKSNKNCNETIENSRHIINIPCKELIKGPAAETWTYNLTLPKNTGNFILNLKRRKQKTVSLNCVFGESVSLVHQESDVIITSNTQDKEQSKLLLLFLLYF